MEARLRILLVDDSPTDLELAQTRLRRALLANPIETCKTAEEALQRLRDAALPRVGLVLVDSRLPGMNGEEMVDEMRADPALKDLPVILVATFPEAALEDRSEGRRPDAAIAKPLSLEALASGLRKVGGFELSLTRVAPK